MKLFGESIDVRASIRTLAGLSGHADKEGLIEWIEGFKEKPRRVFVVHGEDSVCTSFTECLQVEHGIKAYAPYSGTVFNLLSGKLEYEAMPIPVKKKAKTVSDVFSRLLAAGQRLLAVIHKNEGGANKDLAKFPLHNILIYSICYRGKLASFNACFWHKGYASVKLQ